VGLTNAVSFKEIYMKKLLVLGISVLCLTMNKAASAEGFIPSVVEAGFHTGYIPNGFDTNDSIQLVGEGVFRDSCYRAASVRVDVDHENKKITLKPTAYLYDGYCLQVMIPYDQTLDVGFLKAGKYEVVQKSMGAETYLGDVKVRVATNALPDDYLYAPIHQAYFESKQLGKATVKLAGEFTNSCMKLADVMVSIQPKVIVVQPITQLEEQGNCEQGKFAFEREVEIPNLKVGRYLLHVRSLNGKAINTLVDAR